MKPMVCRNSCQLLSLQLSNPALLLARTELVDVGIVVSDDVEQKQSPTNCVSRRFPPSTTLSGVTDEAARCGLVHGSQRILVIPATALLTQNVVQLQALLNEHEEGKIATYATDNSGQEAVTEAQPEAALHGFVPLSRQERTRLLREAIKQLETTSFQGGGVPPSSGDAMALRQLVNEAEQQLKEEIVNARADRDMHMHVVYRLRAAYKEVYESVFEIINKAEGPALRRLNTLVGLTPLPEKLPVQSTGDLVALLTAGARVKSTLYDPYFTRMAASTKRRALKFFPTDLKSVWRCVEKMVFKVPQRNSYEHITDVVRGAICSSSVDDLAYAYLQMVNDSNTRIIRVKNRLLHPHESGWGDCLVNIVFRADPCQHVCEIQFVHEKLMLARERLGAQNSYAYFRGALELLETSDSDGAWQEERSILHLHIKCTTPDGVDFECK
jgi:hypothetical protein